MADPSLVVHKRKKIWTSADEEIVLNMWKKNCKRIKDRQRSTDAYREISQALVKKGRTFYWKEVRDKIHNLKKKYKKEMILIENGEVSDWPAFHKVHDILGEGGESKEESLIEEDIHEATDEETPSEVESTTSQTSTKPPSRKRKRKTRTVADKILKECQTTNAAIMEERNSVRKIDLEMLSIEQERNRILKEFMINAKNFQDNVTKMLNSIK